MKTTKIIFSTILGLLLLFLSSCNPSQTFTVQGIPGTIISNPTNQQLAIIDDTGKTRIKLYRKDGYYHYLQAQAPGSNTQVPFALDYKNHSRATDRGLLKTAYGTTIAIGVASSIGLGIAAFVAGAEGTIIGVFGAVDLVCAFGGLGLSGIVTDRTSNIINYDYDYMKLQTTNSDILK